MPTPPPISLQHNVYKFLQAEHVHYLIKDGTIQFKTHKYYRDLESAQTGIGDKVEGATMVSPVDITIPTGEDKESLQVVENFSLKGGVKVIQFGANVRDVHLSGNVVKHILPQMFVFSASCSLLSELEPIMCPTDGYDACVQILDFNKLVRQVISRGRVINLAGAPVRQIIGQAGAALVKYQSLITLVEPAKPPDPFIKHVDFESQKEVRIVLVPSAPLKVDTLQIKLPNPRLLFQAIQLAPKHSVQAAHWARPDRK